MDRITRLNNTLTSEQLSAKKGSSFSVVDNRTGKSYELPVKNNYIAGKDL